MKAPQLILAGLFAASLFDSTARSQIGANAPASNATGSNQNIEAARELAKVTSTSAVAELMATIAGEVWPAMEIALRVKHPKIDAATLVELRKEFERLQVNLVVEFIQQDSPQIYARHFSAAELRELTAFYRTPLGAKALALMPKASLELLKGMSPRMRQLAESVDEKFAEILRRRKITP